MSLPNPDARRRKPRRSAMSVAGRLLATLVVLLLLAGGIGAAGWVIATADGPLREDKVVNIPQGSTSQQIAEVLEREGVVDSEGLTMLGISGVRRIFNIEPKAGEYAFTAGYSWQPEGPKSSGQMEVV